MKAVRVHAPGGPESMKLEEVPVPAPAAGQAQVKLEAAGVKTEAPIRKAGNGKTSIAFLTDPWGTYIELTEGLAP